MSHSKNRKDSLNDFRLLPFFNLAYFTGLLFGGQMSTEGRFCTAEKKMQATTVGNSQINIEGILTDLFS